MSSQRILEERYYRKGKTILGVFTLECGHTNINWNRGARIRLSRNHTEHRAHCHICYFHQTDLELEFARVKAEAFKAKAVEISYEEVSDWFRPLV